MSVKVDEGACTGCACCVLSCPEGAMSTSPSCLARVEVALCTDCLACLDYCPTDALGEG